MASHDNFDENASGRSYTPPHSQPHKIPNIHDYREKQDERQAVSQATVPEKVENEAPKGQEHETILEAAKRHLHLDGGTSDPAVNEKVPYGSQNRNLDASAEEDVEASNDHRASNGVGPENGSGQSDKGGQRDSKQPEQGGGSILKETSEAIDNTLDPKQKRKNMKHMKRDHAAREVTDPVTHLRVMVHDTVDKEMKAVPENEPEPSSIARTSTGGSAKSKGKSQLERESKEQQAAHSAMEKLFPPPEFDIAKEEIASIYSLALTVGMSAVLMTTILLLVGSHLITGRRDEPRTWPQMIISISLLLISTIALGGVIIWALQDWLKNRIRSVWEDELWHSARIQEQENVDSPVPESTQWLNSVLSSIWPIINPDLFASLADTLEDVMQASLPKLVRMISVEDLGQGNEAIRILGVRWLPTGAAAKNVREDGKIKSGNKDGDNDRKVPGQGEIDDNERKDGGGGHRPDEQGDNDDGGDKEGEGEDHNVAEGMEAEEGNFVNVEVGFSYRASSSGKSLKTKSKNAHLFLAFYLPGGIRFPVWVELRGIVGTMRMRLQLCPDPPFFCLCTFTLLGQPKAELACVPLTKKGLNIMNFPLISAFVQSSIDAALAEYVAPKSLTLDLKDMLVGDDFKKDTTTRGIIMVTIKRGTGFEAGDPGFGPLKKGSSDGYVAVGWAKFGKPVWSTRVITEDMQPVWNETAFIQVGPQELNADERLRVQLWDSDRTSADDDLGRIEVDLKELMHDSRSYCDMWHRTDGFQALEGDKKRPGTLEWSVGYFPKTRIQAEELEQQNVEPDVKSYQELKDKVSKDAENSLREAKGRAEASETDQQKAQILKAREDAMIIATPPLHNFPTGIFSIQIHQITGLEFEKINKRNAEGDEGDETDSGAGDLPSSYCTVILNHQTVFRTRTKPKNAQPFFNAGIERLVRDWKTTEVMVAIRDSRVHENDALLGIVYLPLGKLFKARSQVMDNYPLVGGIGYGRVRISMVFRSVKIQLPKELQGWDYGTVEITGPIKSKDIASDINSLRLKLRTTVNRGKMYTSGSDNPGESHWKGKRDRLVRLAVKKRYASCIVVEFRKNQLGLDKTPAFAVLWLKDIPDEEDCTVSLTVWRGDSKKLKRAQSNCTVDDLGEKAGTIEVPLKYYRGLGAYHHRLANHSPNLQDVLEVLSTANDNQEVCTAMAGDDDADSSDSDSSDEEGPKHAANGLLKKLTPGDKDGSGGDDDRKSDGPLERIKHYKDHSEQLHRRHRGLMQWKVARTGAYLKTKIEHGKDHVLERFGHHERDPGIETEV